MPAEDLQGLAYQGLLVQTLDGESVAIINQACDIGKGNTVLVAPIIKDKDKANSAKSGRVPSAAPLPFNEGVADLTRIRPIEWNKLTSNGGETETVDHSHPEIRTFASRVSRYFGRYAFPDDVVEYFRPLTDLLRNSKNKKRGFYKLVHDEVIEVRAKSADWSNTEATREIIFITSSKFMNRVYEDNTNDETTGQKPLGDADSLCDQFLLDQKPITRSSLNQLESSLEGMFDTISRCKVSFESERDFTYADYASSESLNLESMS